MVPCFPRKESCVVILLLLLVALDATDEYEVTPSTSISILSGRIEESSVFNGVCGNTITIHNSAIEGGLYFNMSMVLGCKLSLVNCSFVAGARLWFGQLEGQPAGNITWNSGRVDVRNVSFLGNGSLRFVHVAARNSVLTFRDIAMVSTDKDQTTAQINVTSLTATNSTLQFSNLSLVTDYSVGLLVHNGTLSASNLTIDGTISYQGETQSTFGAIQLSGTSLQAQSSIVIANVTAQKVTNPESTLEWTGCSISATTVANSSSIVLVNNSWWNISASSITAYRIANGVVADSSNITVDGGNAPVVQTSVSSLTGLTVTGTAFTNRSALAVRNAVWNMSGETISHVNFQNLVFALHSGLLISGCAFGGAISFGGAGLPVRLSNVTWRLFSKLTVTSLTIHFAGSANAVRCSDCVFTEESSAVVSHSAIVSSDYMRGISFAAAVLNRSTLTIASNQFTAVTHPDSTCRMFALLGSSQPSVVTNHSAVTLDNNTVSVIGSACMPFVVETAKISNYSKFVMIFNSITMTSTSSGAALRFDRLNLTDDSEALVSGNTVTYTQSYDYPMTAIAVNNTLISQSAFRVHGNAMNMSCANCTVLNYVTFGDGVVWSNQSQVQVSWNQVSWPATPLRTPRYALIDASKLSFATVNGSQSWWTYWPMRLVMRNNTCLVVSVPGASSYIVVLPSFVVKPEYFEVYKGCNRWTDSLQKHPSYCPFDQVLAAQSWGSSLVNGSEAQCLQCLAEYDCPTPEYDATTLQSAASGTGVVCDCGRRRYQYVFFGSSSEPSGTFTLKNSTAHYYLNNSLVRGELRLAGALLGGTLTITNTVFNSGDLAFAAPSVALIITATLENSSAVSVSHCVFLNGGFVSYSADMASDSSFLLSDSVFDSGAIALHSVSLHKSAIVIRRINISLTPNAAAGRTALVALKNITSNDSSIRLDSSKLDFVSASTRGLLCVFAASGIVLQGYATLTVGPTNEFRLYSPNAVDPTGIACFVDLQVGPSAVITVRALVATTETVNGAALVVQNSSFEGALRVLYCTLTVTTNSTGKGLHIDNVTFRGSTAELRVISTVFAVSDSTAEASGIRISSGATGRSAFVDGSSVFISLNSFNFPTRNAVSVAVWFFAGLSSNSRVAFSDNAISMANGTGDGSVVRFEPTAALTSAVFVATGNTATVVGERFTDASGTQRLGRVNAYGFFGPITGSEVKVTAEAINITGPSGDVLRISDAAYDNSRLEFAGNTVVLQSGKVVIIQNATLNGTTIALVDNTVTVDGASVLYIAVRLVMKRCTQTISGNILTGRLATTFRGIVFSGNSLYGGARRIHSNIFTALMPPFGPTYSGMAVAFQSESWIDGVMVDLTNNSFSYALSAAARAVPPPQGPVAGVRYLVVLRTTHNSSASLSICSIKINGLTLPALFPQATNRTSMTPLQTTPGCIETGSGQFPWLEVDLQKTADVSFVRLNTPDVGSDLKLLLLSETRRVLRVARIDNTTFINVTHTTFENGEWRLPEFRYWAYLFPGASTADAGTLCRQTVGSVGTPADSAMLSALLEHLNFTVMLGGYGTDSGGGKVSWQWNATDEPFAMDAMCSVPPCATGQAIYRQATLDSWNWTSQQPTLLLGVVCDAPKQFVPLLQPVVTTRKAAVTACQLAYSTELADVRTKFDQRQLEGNLVQLMSPLQRNASPRLLLDGVGGAGSVWSWATSGAPFSSPCPSTANCIGCVPGAFCLWAPGGANMSIPSLGQSVVADTKTLRWRSVAEESPFPLGRLCRAAPLSSGVSFVNLVTHRTSASAPPSRLVLTNESYTIIGETTNISVPIHFGTAPMGWANNLTFVGRCSRYRYATGGTLSPWYPLSRESLPLAMQSEVSQLDFPANDEQCNACSLAIDCNPSPGQHFAVLGTLQTGCTCIGRTNRDMAVKDYFDWYFAPGNNTAEFVYNFTNVRFERTVYVTGVLNGCRIFLNNVTFTSSIGLVFFANMTNGSLLSVNASHFNDSTLRVGHARSMTSDSNIVVTRTLFESSWMRVMLTQQIIRTVFIVEESVFDFGRVELSTVTATESVFLFNRCSFHGVELGMKSTTLIDSNFTLSSSNITAWENGGISLAMNVVVSQSVLTRSSIVSFGNRYQTANQSAAIYLLETQFLDNSSLQMRNDSWSHADSTPGSGEYLLFVALSNMNSSWIAVADCVANSSGGNTTGIALQGGAVVHSSIAMRTVQFLSPAQPASPIATRQFLVASTVTLINASIVAQQNGMAAANLTLRPYHFSSITANGSTMRFDGDVFTALSGSQWNYLSILASNLSDSAVSISGLRFSTAGTSTDTQLGARSVLALQSVVAEGSQFLWNTSTVVMNVTPSVVGVSVLGCWFTSASISVSEVSMLLATKANANLLNMTDTVSVNSAFIVSAANVTVTASSTAFLVESTRCTTTATAIMIAGTRFSVNGGTATGAMMWIDQHRAAAAAEPAGPSQPSAPTWQWCQARARSLDLAPRSSVITQFQNNVNIRATTSFGVSLTNSTFIGLCEAVIDGTYQLEALLPGTSAMAWYMDTTWQHNATRVWSGNSIVAWASSVYAAGIYNTKVEMGTLTMLFSSNSLLILPFQPSTAGGAYLWSDVNTFANDSMAFIGLTVRNNTFKAMHQSSPSVFPIRFFRRFSTNPQYDLFADNTFEAINITVTSFIGIDISEDQCSNPNMTALRSITATNNTVIFEGTQAFGVRIAFSCWGQTPASVRIEDSRFHMNITGASISSALQIPFGSFGPQCSIVFSNNIVHAVSAASFMFGVRTISPASKASLRIVDSIFNFALPDGGVCVVGEMSYAAVNTEGPYRSAEIHNVTMVVNSLNPSSGVCFQGPATGDTLNLSSVVMHITASRAAGLVRFTGTSRLNPNVLNIQNCRWHLRSSQFIAAVTDQHRGLSRGGSISIRDTVFIIDVIANSTQRPPSTPRLIIGEVDFESPPQFISGIWLHNFNGVGATLDIDNVTVEFDIQDRAVATDKAAYGFLLETNSSNGTTERVVGSTVRFAGHHPREAAFLSTNGSSVTDGSTQTYTDNSVHFSNATNASSGGSMYVLGFAPGAYGGRLAITNSLLALPSAASNTSLFPLMTVPFCCLVVSPGAWYANCNFRKYLGQRRLLRLDDYGPLANLSGAYAASIVAPHCNMSLSSSHTPSRSRSHSRSQSASPSRATPTTSLTVAIPPPPPNGSCADYSMSEQFLHPASFQVNSTDCLASDSSGNVLCALTFREFLTAGVLNISLTFRDPLSAAWLTAATHQLQLPKDQAGNETAGFERVRPMNLAPITNATAQPGEELVGVILSIPYRDTDTSADVSLPIVFPLHFRQCILTNQPHGFAFNLTLLLQAEPRRGGVPAVVTRTVAAVATVTGSLSTMTGQPTVIMTQLRTNTVQQLQTCMFPHNEPLSALINPTGMGFGDETGYYYRGAIVGNLILLACLFGFFLLLAAVLLVVRRCDPVRSRCESLSEAAKDCLWTLHFPSVVIIPMALGYQGTMATSVSLLLHRPDVSQNEDLAIAIVGQVVCCGSLLALVLLSTPWFFGLTLVRRPRREDTGGKALPRRSSWQRIVDSTAYSTHHWVNKTPGTDWKRRYLMFFNDYRLSYGLALEFAVSAALGVIDGIRVSDLAFCERLSLAAASIMVLYQAIIMYTSLALTPFQQLFVVVMNGTACFAGVLLVVARYMRNDTIADFTEWLALLSNVLGVLRFVMDVLLAAVWLRHRSAEWKVIVAKKLRLPSLAPKGSRAGREGLRQLGDGDDTLQSALLSVERPAPLATVPSFRQPHPSPHATALEVQQSFGAESSMEELLGISSAAAPKAPDDNDDFLQELDLLMAADAPPPPRARAEPAGIPGGSLSEWRKIRDTADYMPADGASRMLLSDWRWSTSRTNPAYPLVPPAPAAQWVASDNPLDANGLRLVTTTGGVGQAPPASPPPRLSAAELEALGANADGIITDPHVLMRQWRKDTSHTSAHTPRRQ